MEKVETQTRQIEERIHHFYCDDCGSHIKSSQEHYDGYYPEYGMLEIKVLMPQGWYKLKKCLCENCREKFLHDAHTFLENAGFEKD